MQQRSTGQLTVSWAWAWPPSSTICFLLSIPGRKFSHTDTCFLIRGFGECLTCFLGLLIRSVVVTLMSGFLIDKLGNLCKFMGVLFTNLWCWFDHNFDFSSPSVVGIYLFSILCILGSALFALGSHFNGTPFLLPLMLAGRLLLGAGSGSVSGKKANTFTIINQDGGPFHSILCILLSFAGSHYSFLV